MLAQGPALVGLCQPGQHLPKPKGEGELALPHPHKLPGGASLPRGNRSEQGMLRRWQRQDTGATGSHLSFPHNQQRCSHPGWSPAALQPYQSGGMTTPGSNSPHPPRWSGARTDSCAGRRTLLLPLLPTGLRFRLPGPQPGCNYKPGRGPISLPPQLLPAPPSPRPVVPRGTEGGH